MLIDIPRATQVNRVWIFVHYFAFSLKTADLAAQLGGFGSFFLQEIHKLSTKTFRNMEERPI